MLSLMVLNLLVKFVRSALPGAILELVLGLTI